MNPTARHFEGILDRYFEAHLADHPVTAAYAGIRDAEGHLGSATPAFVARQTL